MATASSKRDEAINSAKSAREKYERAVIAEANCRKAANIANTSVALQYLAQATEYLNKCKTEMESAEKWSQFAQNTYNTKSSNQELVKTKVAELASYAEQARVLAAKYNASTSASNINNQTTLTNANTQLEAIKKNNTDCGTLVTKAAVALTAANNAKTAANTTQATNWLNGTGLSYTYSGSSQSKTAAAWKSLVDTHKSSCNSWQTTAQNTYNTKSSNQELVKTKVAELASYAEQARVLDDYIFDIAFNIKKQTTLTNANTQLEAIKKNNTDCGTLVTKAAAALTAANNAKTAANTTQATNWLNGTGLSYTYSGSSQSKTAAAWKSLVDTHKTSCNKWSQYAQNTYNSISSAIQSLKDDNNTNLQYLSELNEYLENLNVKSVSSITMLASYAWSYAETFATYYYKIKPRITIIDDHIYNSVHLFNSINTKNIEYERELDNRFEILSSMNEMLESIDSCVNNVIDNCAQETSIDDFDIASNNLIEVVKTLMDHGRYQNGYQYFESHYVNGPSSFNGIIDSEIVYRLFKAALYTLFNSSNVYKLIESKLRSKKLAFKVTNQDNSSREYITFSYDTINGRNIWFNSYKSSGTDTRELSKGTRTNIYSIKFTYNY